MKWTPGPLHVTKDQRREQWGVFSAPTVDASDRLVAVCTREADATLYAAAPALHEALAELSAVVAAAGLHNLSRGVQLGPTAWYLKASDAMGYASKALAAARGES